MKELGMDLHAKLGVTGVEEVAARYGVANSFPISGDLWNSTIELILTHRSIRHYSDRALPDGLLEVLATAAQSAPSSSNLQAFSIVAVEDPARKARLSAFAAGQKHVATAPLLLMFVADLARLRQIAAALGEPADGLAYTESFLVAVTDAAFAAQNALIALESLGLGACYIGAMRNHPQEVADELRLPNGSFVVFGMTVGYPDARVETGVKPRLPQSVVLHRETYQASPAGAYAAYDTTMRRFRLDQVMSDIPWTQQVTGRVRGAESLMGRHVLRDILKARGIGLD